MVYLNSIMDIDEEQLAIECAAEEAKLEGISEGIIEGVTQTAHRMLKKGLDPAFVAEVTGFSINQIMAMR
jgi:predicted transposase/invertase (TIGR01784 family)